MPEPSRWELSDTCPTHVRAHACANACTHVHARLCTHVSTHARTRAGTSRLHERQHGEELGLAYGARTLTLRRYGLVRRHRRRRAQ